MPVVCFVLFNVGDWIGRILAERLAWPSPGKGSIELRFQYLVRNFSRCARIQKKIK